MMFHILISSAIIAGYALPEERTAVYGFSCVYGDVRELAASISNEQAIEIAKKFYVSHLGEHDLDDLAPFTAAFNGRVWLVETYEMTADGAPQDQIVGGRRELTIDAYSGCILRSVIHK